MLDAQVVLAEPFTLMQNGAPAQPTNPTQMSGKVVVIGASGGLTVVKALVAESAGATGVLIVNDDVEDSPSRFAGTDDDFADESSVEVAIPVVVVSNSWYEGFVNGIHTLVNFKAPTKIPKVKAGGTLRFEVRPIDIDEFPITDTTVSFNADLASPESAHKQRDDVNSTLCKITMTDGIYIGQCDFPEHEDKKPWTDDGFSLAIKPAGDDNGNEIARQRIDVKDCPKNYFYDDVDGNGCLSCDDLVGIECPAGTTRTSIPVEEGYWRSHEESLVVLACPW